MVTRTDLPAELDIDSTMDYVRLLIEQMNKPLGVTLFVGAGLSMPFNFPGWKKFLIAQAEKAGIKNGIQGRIDNGEFEEAATDLLDKRGVGNFDDSIRLAYGPKETDYQKRDESVFLLPQVCKGPVITTNFDHVLEDVFEQANRPFEKVVWGAKADSVRESLYLSRRFLLKIHGDAEDRTDRVLTMEEYNTRYGCENSSGIKLSLPLPGILYQVFLSRPLLFLGCSLTQDRTMKLLEQVAKDFSISHYAIVARPTTDKDFQIRAKLLSDRKIRAIWYPAGRREFVTVLLKHLVNETLNWRFLIIGSTDSLEGTTERTAFSEACHQLGVVLAKSGYEVIVGSSRPTTADRYVVEGINEVDNGHQHKVSVVQPKVKREAFQNERDGLSRIHFSFEGLLGDWRSVRDAQLERAGGVIAIGGGKGTKQIIHSALNSGQPIVVIPSLGGSAQEVWDDFVDAYKAYKNTDGLGKDIERLKGQWTPEHAEVAVSILEKLVQLPPPPAPTP
jgi:SIR2-like domain